jgi:hypothetical protein
MTIFVRYFGSSSLVLQNSVHRKGKTSAKILPLRHVVAHEVQSSGPCNPPDIKHRPETMVECRGWNHDWDRKKWGCLIWTGDEILEPLQHLLIIVLSIPFWRWWLIHVDFPWLVKSIHCKTTYCGKPNNKPSPSLRFINMGIALWHPMTVMM